MFEVFGGYLSKGIRQAAEYAYLEIRRSERDHRYGSHWHINSIKSLPVNGILNPRRMHRSKSHKLKCLQWSGGAVNVCELGHI